MGVSRERRRGERQPGFRVWVERERFGQTHLALKRQQRRAGLRPITPSSSQTKSRRVPSATCASKTSRVDAGNRPAAVARLLPGGLTGVCPAAQQVSARRGDRFVAGGSGVAFDRRPGATRDSIATNPCSDAER